MPPTREALPAPQQPEPAGDVDGPGVRTLPAGTYKALRKGDYSILESYLGALRSAERIVYLENQFLWSPEVVDILADKLAHPPTDDFRVVVLLPARANDGADISRGQVAALIEADEGDDRFLACTVYAREGKLRDIVYVHAKVGIVDDRWLTVGSANLNAHSLLHDTEMNIVTHDEAVARSTRLRLWSEHLERSEQEVAGNPATVFDELWRPIATEQLHRIERGEPLTHRLVRLPGVSRGAAGCSARCRATSTTSEPVVSEAASSTDGGNASATCVRLLDRGSEVEEPAAEGDRADREPGPAERETGDDVGEPVHVEHDAAAGDADGDAAGRRGEQGSHAGRALPREHERNGGVERRGGRGMAARERGAEGGGDGIERGADAVEELLDRVDEHDLADQDRDQERRHPPVRGANHLDDDDDEDHEQ